MKEVLVDMHRLKYNHYNGLYSVCINLGKALSALNTPEMQVNYYLPEKDFGIFGPNQKYVKHRSIDKYYQFGTGKYDLWHITTQLSWYHPFNRRTKVLYTLYDFSYLIEDASNVKRNQRLLKQTQERINRADYITGISQFAIDEAKKHLYLGNKPTKAIQLGCTVSEFPDFDSPKYLPLKPFLFTIGLVQPRKNFHVLPPLLIGNDYELVIAGLNNYEYGKEVLVTPTYDDPAYDVILGTIKWYSDKLNLPAEIYQLGAEACQAEIDLIPYPEIIDMYKRYHKMAALYWRAKNKLKAIEAEQEAIVALKNETGFSKTMLAEYELALQKYTQYNNLK